MTTIRIAKISCRFLSTIAASTAFALVGYALTGLVGGALGSLLVVVAVLDLVVDVVALDG